MRIDQFPDLGASIPTGAVVLFEIDPDNPLLRDYRRGNATLLLQSAQNLADLPAPATAQVNLGVREALTANRTYFVSTTGNDSNDGLTALTPWLTLQHAANVLTHQLDLRGFDVTIQLADGTYTAGANLGELVGGLDSTVTWQGNNGTPANVNISISAAGSTGGRCFYGRANCGRWVIKDLLVQTSGSGTNCIRADDGAILTLNNVRFGASISAHIFATGGGQILVSANYTIAGAAPQHYLANFGGLINIVSGITVTVTGTPAFSSAFALATDGGRINAAGITWSGGATGTRHNIISVASCAIGGGGANYFPGNAAGSPVPGTLGTSGGWIN